jgi:hypothetical protein
MAENAAMRQYLAVCGLRNDAPPNRVTQQFIDNTGYTSIELVATYSTENMEEAVKDHNKIALDAGTATIPYVQRQNLKALCYWARDQAKQGIAFDVNNWNAATLRATAARMNAEQALASAEVEKVRRPGKCEVGLGWFDWDERFENFLASMRGARDEPLDYVIRREMPADWNPPNDVVAHKYAILLEGPEYELDNRRVYQYLSDACNGTDAWYWIDRHNHDLNGRATMNDLREHYEGDHQQTNRVAFAEAELKSLVYSNELYYPFEKFATKIKQCYRVLDKKYATTDAHKIKTVKEKIKIEGNARVTYALESVNENGTLDECLTHLGTKLVTIFADKAAEREKRRSKMSKKRQVSEVNRPGGKGRGGPRGKGGKKDDTPTPKHINGVDVSDVDRNFTADEFKKLGAAGRDFVFMKRSVLISGQGRGRGRGGRGRGGRNVREVQTGGAGDEDAAQGDEGQGDNAAGRGGRGRGRGGRAGARFGRGAHPNLDQE